MYFYAKASFLRSEHVFWMACGQLIYTAKETNQKWNYSFFIQINSAINNMSQTDSTPLQNWPWNMITLLHVPYCYSRSGYQVFSLGFFGSLISVLQAFNITLYSVWLIEITFHTNSCTQALFTIFKTWKEQRWPPVGEWIYKLWCIQTMEFLSAQTSMSYPDIEEP